MDVHAALAEQAPQGDHPTAGAPRVVLGIDAGTSAIKCIAVPVSAMSTPTLVHRSVIQSGDAGLRDGQIDPAAIDAAIAELVNAIARFVDETGAQIVAVGVTGQVGGVYAIDAAGSLLSPCLAWWDIRADALAHAMHVRFAEGYPQLLGHHLPRHTCWAAPRLRWFVDHMRQTSRTFRCVMQLSDYVVFVLTGQLQTQATSAIGHAHQGDHRYAPELLRWVGVTPSQLPPLRTARDPAPRLTLPLTRRFRQLQPPPVVPAGGDMFSSLVGFNLQPGDACIQAGTTEITGYRPRRGADQLQPGTITLRTPRHDVIRYASASNGGASISWLQQLLGCSDVGLQQLWQQASAIEPGSAGLLFVPHINGARAPHWRADANGGFVGLRVHHQTAHLLRAVIEACACSKRSVLATLLEHDQAMPARLLVSGGGSHAELANQIRAAVCGQPVYVLPDAQVTALGACAQALGPDGPAWLARYHQAHRPRQVDPPPGWPAVYESLYQHYLAWEERLMPQSADATIQSAEGLKP